MGLLDGQVEIARKTMVIFFLVDASGSMAGDKIGALNQVIREIIPMIGDISDTNADAKIKIAAMQISSGVEWIYGEPKEAADFMWSDLKAGGLTDLGEACLELNSKLSRKAFMAAASGSFAPVLILLSDGGATDNYHSGIAKLKENNWYKAAIKIAIAIGDDSDKDELKAFTGNTEAVFEVHNVEALKKVIRVVTVTSSQIGSKSSPIMSDMNEDGKKQQQIIDTIQEEIKDVDGAACAADPDSAYLSGTDDWD